MKLRKVQSEMPLPLSALDPLLSAGTGSVFLIFFLPGAAEMPYLKIG